MKKIIHTLIAASVLLFASSCVKEIVEGGSSVSSGDEANVVLQLRTPGGFSAPKTRSLTFTDENTIDNIYVLVFNNKNELVEIKQGQSVSSTPGSSSPAYSGTGSFSVTLAASRTSLETYNLVVLANASTIISNTIGFNAAAIADKSYAAVTARISDPITGVMYPSGGTIPMWGESGQLVLAGGTTTRPMTLTRSVARIDVGVGRPGKNSGDEWSWDGKGAQNNTISFRLDHVYVVRPNDFYAVIPDGSLSAGEPTIPSGAAAFSVSDSENKFVFAASGVYSTRDIYIPEADIVMGSGGEPEDDNHLNRMAVVVGGIYNGGNTETFYRLDFAVGGNLVNVLRNHLYQFNISKVSGPGFPTVKEAYEGAHPIEFEVEVIPWGGEVNVPLSYATMRSANSYIVSPDGASFNIPIYGQMGRAIDLGDLPGTWIDASMTLGAEVLWAESPQTTDIVANLNLYTDPIDFTKSLLTVTPGHTVGNAVVCVFNDKNGDGMRDTGDDILWSWHIWSCHSSERPKESGGRWMDRDLGALRQGNWLHTPTSASEAQSSPDPIKGLHYQYGRKDPMPVTNYGRTVQSGTATYGSVSGTATDVRLSVNQPVTLFSSWTGNISSWSAAKSVYDPCPDGWRVPSRAEWQGVTYQSSTPYTWVSSAGMSPLYRNVSAIAWNTTLNTDRTVMQLNNNASGNLVFVNYISGGFHSVRCIRDGAETGATPLLTTDYDSGKTISTDGNTYTINVTSNTEWEAYIKRGTDVVTDGDAAALGKPLLDENAGFNGGAAHDYVLGYENGTLTLTTVDYIGGGQGAQGDLAVVFRDKATGVILDQVAVKVYNFSIGTTHINGNPIPTSGATYGITVAGSTWPQLLVRAIERGTTTEVAPRVTITAGSGTDNSQSIIVAASAWNVPARTVELQWSVDGGATWMVLSSGVQAAYSMTAPPSVTPTTTIPAVGRAQTFRFTGTFGAGAMQVRVWNNTAGALLAGPANVPAANNSTVTQSVNVPISNTLRTRQLTMQYLDPITGNWVTIGSPITQEAASMSTPSVSPTSTIPADGRTQTFSFTGTFASGTTQVRVLNNTTNSVLVSPTNVGAARNSTVTQTQVVPASTAWENRSLAMQYLNPANNQWTTINTISQSGYTSGTPTGLPSSIAETGQTVTITIPGDYPTGWIQVQASASGMVSVMVTTNANRQATLTIPRNGTGSIRSVTFTYSRRWEANWTTIGSVSQANDPRVLSTRRVVAVRDAGLNGTTGATTMHWAEAMGILTTYNTSYFSQNNQRDYSIGAYTGCGGYSEPGYPAGRWRLPTAVELTEMYQKRNEIGGFTTNNYWNALQFNTTGTHAYSCYFNTGTNHLASQKDRNDFSVRCVREP